MSDYLHRVAILGAPVPTFYRADGGSETSARAFEASDSFGDQFYADAGNERVWLGDDPTLPPSMVGGGPSPVDPLASQRRFPPPSGWMSEEWHNFAGSGHNGLRQFDVDDSEDLWTGLHTNVTPYQIWKLGQFEWTAPTSGGSSTGTGTWTLWPSSGPVRNNSDAQDMTPDRTTVDPVPSIVSAAQGLVFYCQNRYAVAAAGVGASSGVDPYNRGDYPAMVFDPATGTFDRAWWPWTDISRHGFINSVLGLPAPADPGTFLAALEAWQIGASDANVLTATDFDASGVYLIDPTGASVDVLTFDDCDTYKKLVLDPGGSLWVTAGKTGEITTGWGAHYLINFELDGTELRRFLLPADPYHSGMQLFPGPIFGVPPRAFPGVFRGRVVRANPGRVG